MNEVKLVSKTAQLSGTIFFAVLFIMSYVFYQQRMMTFDSSFFSFGIIDLKSYNVVVGRWGQLLPQLLPLLVFKLGASLEVFLKTYSVSIILCYYLVFLLLSKTIKHEKAVWILLLSLCLGFRDVFYYATAELHLGIALSVLLYALADNFLKNIFLINKNFYVLIIAVTIVFISQCNPISLFLILFIFLFLMIRDGKYKNGYVWVFLLFSIVWFYIYLKILNQSSYDESKYISVNEFFNQLLRLKNLPSTIYFLSFFKSNLTSLSITTIVLFLLFLKSKNKILSAFCILYLIGYTLLILITYYRGESPIMYQNYYTLYGFFIALPLYDFYTKNWSIGFKNFIVLFLLFVNVRAIINRSDLFTMRLDYISRLEKNSQQISGSKYLISTSNFPWEYAWIRWAFPFESLLHSSINEKKQSQTFYLLDDINQADSLLNKPNVFLGPDWAPLWFESNNLYKPYFNLDNGAYKKLNTQQNDSSNTVYIDKKHMVVFFEKAFYSSAHYKFTVIPLVIQNFTRTKIASIPSTKLPLLIAYSIFDEEGNCIAPVYRRSELETDIIKKVETGLLIEHPKKSGTYTIEAFMIVENKTSASNIARCKFVVN